MFALWVLMGRSQAERANAAVALCLDGPEVVALSRTREFPAGPVARERLPATLAQLKEAGATAVAVSEYTGRDLIAAGYAVVAPQSLLEGPGEQRLAVRFLGPDAAVWARRAWDEVLRRQGIEFVGQLPETMAFLFDLPVAWFETQSFGLAPSELEAVRNAGLQLVVRVSNAPDLDADRFAQRLGQAGGASVVIFLGDEVGGYPAAIADAATALEQAGMHFGFVEFARQRGEAALARALDGAIVRVHSVSAAELATLAPATVADRFARAATERGIRLCYLRLPAAARADIARATEFVRTVSDGLDAARGIELGAAGVPPPLHSPLWVVAVILVGSVAAGKYALRLLAPVPSGWLFLLWALEAGALLALLLVSPWWARRLAALLAAMVFPVLAMLLVARAQPWGAGRAPALGALLGRSIGGALLAAGVAVVGGMLLAALLTDRLTMTKVIAFTGVRLSQAAPFALLALVFAADAWAREDAWRPYRLRITGTVRALGQCPLLLWQAGAAVVLLGGVGFWLARAGHELGVGVSGLEMQLRAAMEDIFWARPRLKEIFVGHPALVVGIALAHGRCPGLAKLFLLIGSIAPISIVNTFAHLHSPLTVTFARTVHAAWVGVLLGALAVVVLYALDRGRCLWPREPAPRG